MSVLEFGPREREVAAALLRHALEEDGAASDITSELAVPAELVGEAQLRFRQPGVMSGISCVEIVFDALEVPAEVVVQGRDGDWIEADTAVATVRAKMRHLLAAERTFLNIIAALSGTATMTRNFVDRAGPDCVILDTRKTWPGARVLQKYAVRCGGGENHRMGLDDAILVKDNHRWDGLSLSTLVQRARERHPGRLLEIEVDDLHQLEEVLALDVDRVMLDNFDAAGVRRAVQLREGASHRPDFEVSGGVHLESVAEFARAGADFISVGSLTHSAPALDIGLDLSTDPAARS